MIHRVSFADSPASGYWHDAMINDLLELTPAYLGLNLLVTPGHFRDGEAINQWLAENGPCIVWILGDEEGDCPFWLVNAPIWKQFPSPHVPHWPDRVLPLGYTPHTRGPLKEWGIPEKSGWVFAGQNTNRRRAQCVEALERINPEWVHESPTFTGGLEPEPYMRLMWEAGWAPCPAGNVRADSFRMWEALEAGAVPILDATSPVGDRNVWPDTLGDHPLPVVENWADVGDILTQPPPLVGPWYTRYKRELRRQLEADWVAFVGEPWIPPEQRLTAILTASPLPSHPDFTILTQTVESVRERLPGNEICIVFDGPREPDAKYEEHIRRVSYWANLHWPEVWIWYTGKWKHQAGTLKDVMPHIKTGAVLVLEADTPLVGDIPFERLVELVYNEDFNHIRLHYDTKIHDDHRYLMRGELFNDYMRTVQYSQRPHIARTPWYTDFLSHIPSRARTYVEDVVYGWVVNSPWEQYKLGVYHPLGDIQRSTHLDGRAGIPKGDFWFE